MVAQVGNWVGEITTTVGIGQLALGGSVEGFVPFQSAMDDGEVWYAIIDGTNKEAGIGTLTGDIITRTQVFATLFEGTYNEVDPTPIALSGNASVYSTFNTKAFEGMVSNDSPAIEVPFLLPDTIETEPALAWSLETTLGLWRKGAGLIGVAGSIDVSGDISKGNVVIPYEAPIDGNSYARSDAGWVLIDDNTSQFVLKAGDTMTGLLNLSGDGVNPLNPVTVQQIVPAFEAVQDAILDLEAVNILSGDTTKIAITNPTLADDVTVSAVVAQTGAGAGNAGKLVEINNAGFINPEYIQVEGITPIGFWDPLVDGDTPPVSGTLGNYYIFTAAGNVTLKDGAAPANPPALTAVDVSDKMIWLEADPLDGNEGWYFWPAASTGTLPASSVIVDDTSFVVLTPVGTSQQAFQLIDDIFAGLTNAPWVEKAGDTMTGFLTLSADPTSALHAATKGYVDAGLAAIPTPPVSSVFTRTGDVVALVGDYAAFYMPLATQNTAYNKNFGTTAGTVLEGDTVFPPIPVDSVFGRTGAVVAVGTDYDAFYANIVHTHTVADITDLNLSGYLLNTTDTFTGDLTIVGTNRIQGNLVDIKNPTAQDTYYRCWVDTVGGFRMKINSAAAFAIEQIGTDGSTEQAWITAARGAGVALKHGGNTKIATDSGGVVVTGLVNAQGAIMREANPIEFQDAGATTWFLNQRAGAAILDFTPSGNGNAISFRNSAGTASITELTFNNAFGLATGVNEGAINTTGYQAWRGSRKVCAATVVCLPDPDLDFKGEGVLSVARTAVGSYAITLDSSFLTVGYEVAKVSVSAFGVFFIPLQANWNVTAPNEVFFSLWAWDGAGLVLVDGIGSTIVYA